MALRIATRGIHVFTLIWLGQLFSTIGTGLTNFAVGIWVYQRTGSATQFALIVLFGGLPSGLILPLAGALTDRWDRRTTMILSHSGAALTTLAAAVLLSAGRLEVWHVYVGVTLRGIFSAFLNPALLASTTLLVPQRHFGRASGMLQSVQASSQVVSPLLAAILLGRIQLRGILVIDFVSYLAAITPLLLVSIPSPERAAGSKTGGGSLLREIAYGWTYIRERHGLLALLVYFAAVNFVLGSTVVLFTPMILSFTSAEVLGTILSVSGIGFLCGSLVMSVWGGPKNRVGGVLGFGFAFGLCCVLVGLRPSAMQVAAGAFGMYFALPFVNGCSQAIWQSKIPPDVQGRVFAIRRIIVASTLPVAYLIAGPLADRVFEPLVRSEYLTRIIQADIGQGPGRGIGLMFIFAGVLTMLAQLCGYLYDPLRRVEDDLPDAVPSVILTGT
ncbi:MAG: MFS transporter [Pyrinomonadaceae bacterium]